MLAAKGMRFPIDVILVCIRWYAWNWITSCSKSSLLRTRQWYVN